MTTKWMECLYKCSCHKDERKFLVEARQVAEDIEVLMHRVADAMTKDHKKRSPFCQAKKVEYMKVPIDKEGKVGVVDGGTA